MADRNVQEIWKDISGYEGRYRVSNYGNVRSLPYSVEQTSRWGTLVSRRCPGSLMTPTGNGNGYLIVGLRKNAKRRSHYVHRLVAAAFIHQKHGCNYINHLDYNKDNNAVWNLEWTTQRENVLHSVERMRKPRKTHKKSSTGEKYIYQRNGKYRLSLPCGLDVTFNTINEAIERRRVVLDDREYFTDGA
jgi:NUMOD4 motif.